MMKLPIILATAALVGAPALAQRADAPLGDILEAIEQEPAPPPAPPSPPPARPAPVQGSSIGTIDLPASEIEVPEPAAEIDSSAELGPSPEADQAEMAQEADDYWRDMLEQRRSAVNAVESPLIERLNSEVASRLEASRREAEQAEADYAQAMADHEAAIRRGEEEREAEMARYRDEVARQRADYEARVKACLDGIRKACAQPGE